MCGNGAKTGIMTVTAARLGMEVHGSVQRVIGVFCGAVAGGPAPATAGLPAATRAGRTTGRIASASGVPGTSEFQGEWLG